MTGTFLTSLRRSIWRTAAIAVLSAAVGPAFSQELTLPKMEQPPTAETLNLEKLPAEPARTELVAPVELAAPVDLTAPASLPATPPTLPTTPALVVDPNVVQASCPSCSSSLPPMPSMGGSDGSCGTGGCATGCGPGRKSCDCCFGDGRFGRLMSGVFECICCPDPCYESRWLPVQDSAFFMDAARPKTQTRLRWTNLWNMDTPDKAEYFWARARNSMGGTGKGPVAVSKLDYQDLALYTEGATDRVGAFVEIPYRSIDPSGLGTFNGFADMNVGAKTLLFDCELMQITTQFKTFIPTGTPTKGLGVGHVSLEPSLLGNLKLASDCYLQSQLALWIPIGGDPQYQGNVFHYHFSFNKVLWKPCNDLLLVGNLEFGGYNILNGQYTDPVTLLPMPAQDVGHILNVGPGARLFICEKYDIGIGTLFAVTNDNVGSEAVRVDFRWRF